MITMPEISIRNKLMRTKLLFVAVLSFVTFSGLQAQNADLIKVINPSAPLHSSRITPFSVANGKIYELPEDNTFYYIIVRDTTNVSSIIGIYPFGNPVVLSSDIQVVGDRLAYIINTSTLNVFATAPLSNLSSGSGFNQSILGKTSIHRYLAEDIGDTFYTYDENNNRAIRFVPEATAPRGFLPDYEVSLASVTSNSADVRHFGVWNQNLYIINSGNNTIYRTDSTGAVTASYDLVAESPVPNISLEAKRISVESNGRIVLLAKQARANISKAVAAGTSHLLYFDSDLNFLGNTEIPASSSRGNFEEDLAEIDVDEDGNIYLGELGKRSITMLDYYNHAPSSPINPIISHVDVILGDTVSIPRSVFNFKDLNTNDSLHSVKLYNQIGANVARVYFDENENGLFETIEEIKALLDTVIISAKKLTEGRLVIAFNEANGPSTDINLGELIYAWSDDGSTFSEYKGSLKFNTYSKYITVNGLQGKDGWRILTSYRDNEILSEFLEPVWTQGAYGSDFPAGEPNVFSYHSAKEEWVPIINLDTTLSLGDAFAIYLFEDDEQFISGIQGGWPKQLEVNSSKVALPHGQEITLPLNYDTELTNPTFQGLNLVGNPYGLKLHWRTGVQLANTSTQIAYWSSFLNIGDGGYVYSNVTSANAVISYGQGFWLRATGSGASVGFNSSTTQNGSSVVPKAAPISKLTLRLNDENYTDEIQFFSTELNAFSPKLASLSKNYHEIYTLIESASSQPFAVNSVALGEELRVPLGIRSTRFEKATISLDIENLSDSYSGEYIQQRLKSGELKEYNLRNESVEIPLIKVGQEWVHEGSLALVLSKSGLVSNEDENEVPEVLSLSAYPNPFNPTTNLEFSLPEASRVFVEVYSITGQKVATLLSGEIKQAGRHDLKLDFSSQASGIYLVQIHTEKGSTTRKISLIK